MDAKNPICFLFRDEFDHALSFVVRLGSRVTKEGKFADTVFYALFFQLLLILSGPCNFRVGVDDRWNCAVVDMSVTFSNDLDGCDT
jgi:hypothetical protein